MAFARLKKNARKLQKTLGGIYMTHSALCHFYARAVQEERSWPYVDDNGAEIKPETLQSKIELASEKHVRVTRSLRSSRKVRPWLRQWKIGGMEDQIKNVRNRIQRTEPATS